MQPQMGRTRFWSLHETRRNKVVHQPADDVSGLAEVTLRCVGGGGGGSSKGATLHDERRDAWFAFAGPVRERDSFELLKVGVQSL
ncbi:hypothetical protein [Streptomyces kronopolitis]|uniref:hypothetical protein n=1 Tax=Streptomyces kronopolitis TaxID=1612435 RepID=UPI0016675F96|nr:hypothetical protein [Streptomyces kronopolitis]